MALHPTTEYLMFWSLGYGNSKRRNKFVLRRATVVDRRAIVRKLIAGMLQARGRMEITPACRPASEPKAPHGLMGKAGSGVIYCLVSASPALSFSSTCRPKFIARLVPKRVQGCRFAHWKDGRDDVPTRCRHQSTMLSTVPKVAF
jgi:hypothetical protein